jgi:hypothetical protein
MSGISPLTWMLFAWGAVTTVFVLLMIYRSIISMREDDQLFLNPQETALEAEQKVVMSKMHRLAPYTKASGYASAALALLCLGLWLYQAINQFNAPAP